MQKTYAEIIDETLAAGYTLTNRATEPGSIYCYYIHPANGVSCAVGRCCIAPQSDWQGPFTCLAPTASSKPFDPNEREALLKPEYRGHSAFFWMDLQSLHDNDLNWTDHGISEVGKSRAKDLRSKWCKQ